MNQTAGMLLSTVYFVLYGSKKFATYSKEMYRRSQAPKVALDRSRLPLDAKDLPKYSGAILQSISLMCTRNNYCRFLLEIRHKLKRQVRSNEPRILWRKHVIGYVSLQYKRFSRNPIHAVCDKL
jgi:hypothetical protein